MVDAVTAPARASTLTSNTPACPKMRPTSGEVVVTDDPSPNRHRNSVPPGNEPFAVNWKSVLYCTPAPPGTELMDVSDNGGAVATTAVGVGDVGADGLPLSPTHPAIATV